MLSDSVLRSTVSPLRGASVSAPVTVSPQREILLLQEKLEQERLRNEFSDRLRRCHHLQESISSIRDEYEIEYARVVQSDHSLAAQVSKLFLPKRHGNIPSLVEKEIRNGVLSSLSEESSLGSGVQHSSRSKEGEHGSFQKNDEDEVARNRIRNLLMTRSNTRIEDVNFATSLRSPVSSHRRSMSTGRPGPKGVTTEDILNALSPSARTSSTSLKRGQRGDGKSTAIEPSLQRSFMSPTRAALSKMNPIKRASLEEEIYRAEEKKRKEKIRSRMVDDLWDGSSISPAHGDADNESAQLERAVLRLVIDEGEIHKLTPKQIHDRYLRSVQFLKKYRSSVDRVLSGDYSIAELAEEIASEDESENESSPVPVVQPTLHRSRSASFMRGGIGFAAIERSPSPQTNPTIVHSPSRDPSPSSPHARVRSSSISWTSGTGPSPTPFLPPALLRITSDFGGSSIGARSSESARDGSGHVVGRSRSGSMMSMVSFASAFSGLSNDSLSESSLHTGFGGGSRGVSPLVPGGSHTARRSARKRTDKSKMARQLYGLSARKGREIIRVSRAKAEERSRIAEVAEKYGRTVEEMINHVEDDDSLTEALSSGIHTQKLLRFKRLRLLGQLREDLRNRLHRSMTIRGPWEVDLVEQGTEKSNHGTQTPNIRTETFGPPHSTIAIQTDVEKLDMDSFSVNQMNLSNIPIDEAESFSSSDSDISSASSPNIDVDVVLQHARELLFHLPSTETTTSSPLTKDEKSLQENLVFMIHNLTKMIRKRDELVQSKSDRLALLESELLQSKEELTNFMTAVQNLTQDDIADEDEDEDEDEEGAEKPDDLVERNVNDEAV